LTNSNEFWQQCAMREVWQQRTRGNKLPTNPQIEQQLACFMTTK